MLRFFSLLCSLVVGLAGTTAVLAADWPRWLGPARNGSSPETGLLLNWPAYGPKVLWKVAGGDGYSTVAVARDRCFTLIQRDDQEAAVCWRVADGKELWATRIGPAYKNNYGNGPRSTPTIEEDRVYVQSVTGNLACLNIKNGEILWQHNIVKDFGSKVISWGLSASPLVEGDLVYAIPGGEGAAMVAYNKKTGELVWKSGNDHAAYASPIPIEGKNGKQILFFLGAALVSVTPDQGKELWRIPWETDLECNICTPLIIGQRFFVSSGEGVGCAMLELQEKGSPKVVWESKGKKSVMINYWANSVHHDGHLYGFAGEFDKRIDLRCVDAKTGQVKWSKGPFGKGAVTLAEGHLFITTKTGDLVLVEATPTAYNEKARVRLLAENRTSPTISNGRLFLRDRQHIMCLDIKK